MAWPINQNIYWSSLSNMSAFRLSEGSLKYSTLRHSEWLMWQFCLSCVTQKTSLRFLLRIHSRMWCIKHILQKTPPQIFIQVCHHLNQQLGQPLCPEQGSCTYFFAAWSVVVAVVTWPHGGGAVATWPHGGHLRQYYTDMCPLTHLEYTHTHLIWCGWPHWYLVTGSNHLQRRGLRLQ